MPVCEHVGACARADVCASACARVSTQIASSLAEPAAQLHHSLSGALNNSLLLSPVNGDRNHANLEELREDEMR